jgi:hypothetical protein
MKAIRMKALFLAFLLCALTTLAQARDQRLVGTWTQEGQVAATWTFRPDGSGFMEQENPRTTARFTWSCSGNTLQVSTAGLSVPYTVVSNDGNSLVIRNEQIAATYHLRRKA